MRNRQVRVVLQARPLLGKTLMMKLIMLVGVAAIGGLVYVNNQRGRQLSLDDLRVTARELFGTAKRRAVEVKDRSEQRIVHDVAANLADATAPKR